MAAWVHRKLLAATPLTEKSLNYALPALLNSKLLSQTRRAIIIAAPHMFYMQARLFERNTVWRRSFGF
jgi:hypothetical protein